MSIHRVTYIVLIILSIISIGYFYLAHSLPISNNDVSIGPDYFPKILAIILLVLCIINFIQTWRKKNVQSFFTNSKFIFITIGLVILYLLSWSLFGYFYLTTFLFLSIIFFIYKPSKKHLPLYIVLAILITIIIHLLFNIVVGVRF